MVCIQSGHIFYTVTVALQQTASSTAYEGGGFDARYLALGQHNVSNSLLNRADIRLLHQAL
ncbi:hypothetical protein M405DRAFT_817424, partial [Rhizopogon salebrosus TDB-379]